jgi:hypothetical protein
MGVYLATLHDNYQLRVWTLTESSRWTHWVLKHHVDLEPLTMVDLHGIRVFDNTWTIVDDDNVHDDDDDDDDDDADDDDMMMKISSPRRTREWPPSPLPLPLSCSSKLQMKTTSSTLHDALWPRSRRYHILANPVLHLTLPILMMLRASP